MRDNEVEMPTTSTSATPETPTPLIDSSEEDDSPSLNRKSTPLCNCLPVGPPETCLTDISIPHTSLTRKVGAEFVGTFMLIFAAAAGPIVNQKYYNNDAESLIGNAACSGLAVMIIVLSTGHISGAHLNPSVTIAFAALRHFPWMQVPGYIAAQVLASICASFTLKALFHPFMSGGVTVPSVGTGQALAFEFLITFNLLFVITAVATDTRAVGELARIAIGATVLLNILIAGPSSGASMNPARTLGPAIASGNYKSLWIYLVAPTIGVVAGVAIYTLVKLRGEDESEPHQERSRIHTKPSPICSYKNQVQLNEPARLKKSEQTPLTKYQKAQRDPNWGLLYALMTVDSSATWKRRRFLAVSPMESELAKATLAAAREKYGRDIRVFETSLASGTSANVSDMEETDDFYEFTAEDYYRILATNKKEDKYLKTKKIRDAEAAARRSRMTKASIRVRFPDNHTLEASFHPSEAIQSLVDLVNKVVEHPELPFYLYTTPPKKQIKDMSQDFYSAGFVPGAIVYFTYDVPKGDDDAPFNGPFLRQEVMSLKGLESVAQQTDAVPEPSQEPATTNPSVVPEQTEQKSSEKRKMGKPKWLKM